MGLEATNSGVDEGLGTPESVDIHAITKRYDHETQRRLRADAISQYEELESSSSSRLGSLADDPFVDHEALNARPPALVDGQEVKVIICACSQKEHTSSNNPFPPLMGSTCHGARELGTRKQTQSTGLPVTSTNSSHCSGRRMERDALRSTPHRGRCCYTRRDQNCGCIGRLRRNLVRCGVDQGIPISYLYANAPC